MILTFISGKTTILLERKAFLLEKKKTPSYQSDFYISLDALSVLFGGNKRSIVKIIYLGGASNGITQDNTPSTVWTSALGSSFIPHQSSDSWYRITQDNRFATLIILAPGSNLLQNAWSSPLAIITMNPSKTMVKIVSDRILLMNGIDRSKFGNIYYYCSNIPEYIFRAQEFQSAHMSLLHTDISLLFFGYSL